MIMDDFFATHKTPRPTSQRDASSRRLDDKARGFSGTKSDHSANVRPTLVAAPEESLVIDDRSSLSPAQAVENKLMNLLRETSMPVSHLQMRGLLRNRFEA